MIRLINKPITYSRDAASRRGGRAGAGDERSEIRILYFFCTPSIVVVLVIGLTAKIVLIIKLITQMNYIPPHKLDVRS